MLLLTHIFQFNMAKKIKTESTEKLKFWNEMGDETVQTIIAIFCFLVTILSLFAAFQKAGIVGEYSFAFFTKMFGIGYYLIPIVFVMLGISFLRGLKKRFEISKAVGALLFFISGLGIIHVTNAGSGGVVGNIIAYPLLKLIDTVATYALLIAVFLVSLLIIFNVSLWHIIAMFKKQKTLEDEKRSSKMDETEEAVVDKAVHDQEEKSIARDVKPAQTANEKTKKKGAFDLDDVEAAGFASSVILPHLKPFNPPPLSLLEKDKGKPETGDIKSNATASNDGDLLARLDRSAEQLCVRYDRGPATPLSLEPNGSGAYAGRPDHMLDARVSGEVRDRRALSESDLHPQSLELSMVISGRL
jgi:S-DNA-T family DNA segregation ATPase FtsK/SpoIIIE